MNKKLLVLLPCLAMLLSACNNPGSKSSASGSQSQSGGSSKSSQAVVAVEGVQISQESATLDIGGVLDLAAVAKPSTLEDKSVVWSSDAEGVAKVSDAGRVTAVGAGVAHIRAAAKADTTKYAECTVTVNKEQVLCYAYTPVIGTAYKYGTFQESTAVNAMIYAKDGTLASNRFNSVKNWADAINFYFENGSAAGKYHVALGEGAAKKYLNIKSEEDYHFVVEDSAKTDWEWDEDYCTVKTYVKGTYNCYYFGGTYNEFDTLSSCSWSMIANDYVCRFYMKADKVAATSITLRPTTADVFAGESLKLEARLQPYGAADAIKWSTDNAKVTVKDGLVTVPADVAPETKVKVTAKVSDTIKAETTITVKEKINYGTKDAPLTVAQAKAVIDKFAKGALTGSKIFVKGIVSSNTALNNNKQTLAWLTNDDGSVEQEFEAYNCVFDASIGDTAYAAANSLYGKEIVVTGWGTNFNGTYEISNKDASGAYDNGCILKVNDPATPLKVTSVVVDKTTATVKQGGILQLEASLRPFGAIGTIVWSVEGNDKVTVKDGLVTVDAAAVVGSTATVKATCGTVSGSCVITVETSVTATPLEKPITLTTATMGISKTSYADVNGTHTVEGRDFVTSQVCYKKQTDKLLCLQFQASKGYISLDGAILKKITVVVISTYDFNKDANQGPTITIGTTELKYDADAIQAAAVKTGEKNSNNYEFLAFTIEVTVPTGTTGEFKIAKTTANALYVQSIVLE